ncbi:MAG: hypothetical protein P4L28_02690 [Paludibacteraceae bacterium]|nr:hypothetical protein [Paludibacteraceae bacterium]
MKKNLLYPFLIVSMLLCSTMLFATKYYVSTSGTVSNNGLTSSTPTTLANAINSKATTSGDSVIIAAGTYTPTAQLVPLAGISIIGTGSATTIIDCSSYPTSYTTNVSLFYLTKSNISTSGITIQYCNGSSYYNTYGGAIYIKGSSALTGISFSDVILKNNQAQYGAGIYAQNATLSITSSTFTGNTFASGSNGYGGAMYLVNCVTNINNSDINGNSGLDGAGIYANSGTLTINNSIIENNTSNAWYYHGGGIYAISATVTISNSKIRGNIAYDGGGVYAESGTLTLINTNIYNNTTAATNQGYGGGLYLKSNTSSITNCDMSNNMAGSAGGAIYICGGTTNISNATISYNSQTIFWASGSGGVYVDCSASLTVANSIVSGNTDAVFFTNDNLTSTGGTVDLAGTVIGSTYYDANGNSTANAFNPSTDLGSVDSNGNITVKKAKKCTWKTTTSSTNWNTASNWVEGYVPMGYSNVILPSGAIAYPILTSTTYAACDTIYFKAGAEIGQPQYLSYQSAKIDMEVARSRWYLVNAPLKNVYSGDYTFTGLKPLTYIRDWSVAVQTNQTSVSWATAISTLDAPFNMGKSFIVYLTSTDLSATTKTITFPSTSNSYQYYYTNNVLSPVPTGNYTGTLNRSNADRFIFEDSNNNAPSSFTETLTTNGTAGAYYVVNNPFMSHLDFSAFYTQNSSVINNEVKIWDSSAKQFVTYTNISNAPIPPMQSFIVKLKHNGTSTVTFTYAMSKTDATTKLKAASIEANVLHIQATRSTDVSNLSLAFKNSDSIAADTNYVKSTERLFSGMVKTTPTLYAYVDSKYLDFHTASDSTVIPVGIQTTSSGSTILTFDGMENFTACKDIIFKDSVAGVSLSLMSNSTYTFNNPGGNVAGRFSIQFIPLKSATVEEGTTTGVNQITSNDAISITATNKKVKVTSSTSTISSVSIYDLQGRLIIANTGINAKSTEVRVNGTNTYVVKCSDNAGNSKTEKVVVP